MTQGKWWWREFSELALQLWAVVTMSRSVKGFWPEAVKKLLRDLIGCREAKALKWGGKQYPRAIQGWRIAPETRHGGCFGACCPRS